MESHILGGSCRKVFEKCQKGLEGAYAGVWTTGKPIVLVHLFLWWLLQENTQSAWHASQQKY
jgi:hypothetical protein